MMARKGDGVVGGNERGRSLSGASTDLSNFNGEYLRRKLLTEPPWGHC